jgi:hypothetical protein
MNTAEQEDIPSGDSRPAVICPVSGKFCAALAAP